MCVQVTKTTNRFEISSLLEMILLKQVRWCLTFVGLYILLGNYAIAGVVTRIIPHLLMLLGIIRYDASAIVVGRYEDLFTRRSHISRGRKIIPKLYTQQNIFSKQI